MNNKNSISDIIISRIHLKRMENFTKVKSLTLGVEIWDELMKELHKMDWPSYYNGLHDNSFCGYSVKISHKRPRLIQINMDIKRRRKIYYYGHNPYLDKTYYHQLFSLISLKKAPIFVL